MSIKTKRIGNAIAISDINSDAFDWPSGEGEVWRHVTNYELFDNNTLAYENLEVYRDLTRLIVLRGELLPHPDCCASPVLVEIPISCYSIDFGRSLDDVNRGFWLSDVNDVWYKLEESHHDYYSIATPCLNLFSQYLKFYDAIVYGCGNQSRQALATKTRRTRKFSCTYDIDTIHRFSHGYFDIEIVKRHAHFFFNNSTSAFERDCRMMTSLAVRYALVALVVAYYTIFHWFDTVCIYKYLVIAYLGVDLFWSFGLCVCALTLTETHEAPPQSKIRPCDPVTCYRWQSDQIFSTPPSTRPHRASLPSRQPPIG